MKVLVLHNAYQHRGGEDAVADSEVAMLQSFGHEVERLQRHNAELKTMAVASAAAQTLWSASSHTQVSQAIARFRPEVVHAHNTFPLLSPSVYWACAKAGVPVVQTLHNFRLACPQAMFLRDGKVCEDCLGAAPWPALRHACYRNSRAETGVLSGMLVLHRQLNTWSNKVSLYIVLNEFCRRKFVQAGLPQDKLVIKPNFVDAPKPVVQPRNGLLFVGRLSEEKGVAVLAKACRQVAAGTSVDVVGDGPQQGLLQGLGSVRLHGALPQPQVLQKMSSATALVLPSICYESFPRTLVEAFASGLPVLASRIGALAELVTDGQTGLHFTPGDDQDLAQKMLWVTNHPTEMAQMGVKARQEYEERYTPQQNHAVLMSIYQRAIHGSPA